MRERREELGKKVREQRKRGKERREGKVEEMKGRK